MPPRPIVDLGPDFDQRWKRAPLATRRAFVAELRDLYVMLEHRDEHLIARLKKGSIPPLRDTEDDLPLLASAPLAGGLRQGTLFADAGPEEAVSRPTDAGTAPAPMEVPASSPTASIRENPFLPRSVLDRLQETRSRVASLGQPLPPTPPRAAPAGPPPALPPLPQSHEQSDLERELRLKLGPMVESLIDAQMEGIRSELRLRLRLEMDRLIAEHLRK
jgi:hypothetical protein